MYLYILLFLFQWRTLTDTHQNICVFIILEMQPVNKSKCNGTGDVLWAYVTPLLPSHRPGRCGRQPWQRMWKYFVSTDIARRVIAVMHFALGQNLTPHNSAYKL